MNVNTTPPLAANDEDHALVDAVRAYIGSDSPSPDQATTMRSMALQVVMSGRHVRRPQDVDIRLWQEVHQAMREVSQHIVLKDGSAAVLAFMPVTLGIKQGVIYDFGGRFDAQPIAQQLSKMIDGTEVSVADGWFSEDQVLHAEFGDLRGLLTQMVVDKKLTNYWEPQSLTTQEDTLFSRMFLAVALTVPGPLPAGWSYESPFRNVRAAENGEDKIIEDLVWSAVEHGGQAEVCLQVMEPMMHQDAIAESQTQVDLLKIEHALQYLNAQADTAIAINADLLLQVVWPQAPEDVQHADAAPSLRFRILYQVQGDPEAHQHWYPISYKANNNPRMWQGLLTEVMQMCYALGHQHLEIEQISGGDFQASLMSNAMEAPAMYQ
jgi:hypothetical protein